MANGGKDVVLQGTVRASSAVAVSPEVQGYHHEAARAGEPTEFVVVTSAAPGPMSYDQARRPAVRGQRRKVEGCRQLQRGLCAGLCR